MKHRYSLNYVLFVFSVAFLATFAGARVFNLLLPQFYTPGPAHHFFIGVILLTISGILPHIPSIFRGSRSRFSILLFQGFAAGLTFDEVGMMIFLSDADHIRWRYDGLIMVMTAVMAVVTAKSGILFIKNHWPFKK